MTIILDAMGSDKYPEPEILAAVELAITGANIILVGRKKLILQNCDSLNIPDPRITIEHAPEVVDMWDKPVESAQKKPNNSMAVGVRLIKEGKG